ncbi:MAG: type III pantothenate kinase [Agarilytica sp.]
MKLLFDVGNTRIKWGLSKGGEIAESGAFFASELKEFCAQVSKSKCGEVGTISISSVAGLGLRDEIAAWSRDSLGLVPYIANVEREVAGVRVSYDNLANLGVDRWLAMIAAWQRCRSECIVISAGTAITVDYLGHTGHHGGGLIVPGVNLMRRVLFDRTNAVKVDAFKLLDAWAPGADTIPCVKNGIAAMVKGFIGEVCGSGFESLPVFLSGGDAKSLSVWLESRAEVAPHLVLEGLMCVS